MGVVDAVVWAGDAQFWSNLVTEMISMSSVVIRDWRALLYCKVRASTSSPAF